MKVLFFSPTSNGGHPAYVQEVMSALKQEDPSMDLTLLTREDISPEFRDVPYKISPNLPPLVQRNEFRWTFQWLISRVFHYIKTESYFVRYCMKARPEVIHLQEFTPVLSIFSTAIFRFFLHAKVVLTIHNVRPHKYPKLAPKRFIDFLNRVRVGISSYSIVHTPALKLLATQLWGKQIEGKILVAPHGLWSYYKTPNHASNEGRTHLFYFGVIRQNKGIHIFLEALLILDSKNIQIPSIICGKIEDPFYFQRTLSPLIDKLRAAGYPLIFRAEFITSKEIQEYSIKSKFLILPYLDFFAQSGILFDALALQLPILTTPGHSISDFIEQNGFGAVARSTTPQHFADLIVREFTSAASSAYQNRWEVLMRENSWCKHAQILLKSYYAD